LGRIKLFNKGNEIKPKVLAQVFRAVGWAAQNELDSIELGNFESSEYSNELAETYRELRKSLKKYMDIEFEPY
jgi:hypothetical protein